MQEYGQIVSMIFVSDGPLVLSGWFNASEIIGEKNFGKLNAIPQSFTIWY